MFSDNNINIKDLMILVCGACAICGIVEAGITITHPNLGFSSNDSFYLTQGFFFIVLGSIGIVVLTRERYAERRTQQTLS